MTPWRVGLLAAGIVLLVMVPLAANSTLHLRADAMSNTALAHAVRRHGLPPSDPYLAGQPLHYHWGYNAAVAGLSALTGIEPLPLMVWLGPLALAMILVSASRLARWLGGGDGGAALALVLVAVGLNGWGWLLLATRWVVGQVGFTQALTSGVSPFLHLLIQGYDVRLAFFVTKALVATSFIWDLAFLAIAVSAFLRFMQEGGWRHGAVFVLAAAAAAYATTQVGAGLLALVVAGLAVRLCLWRRREGTAARSRALAALGLVALSLALVVPYLVVVMGDAASEERLVWLAPPDGFHLLGAAAGLAPLWICAALIGRPKRWGPQDLWLAYLAAGFVGAFLLVRVVDGVQTKFLFVAAMLLPVYVGSRSADLAAWRRRALWLAAASAVPTTALGLVAYVYAPDTIDLSKAEAATFDWIARNTPRETVVVARERSTLVPILARRDLYVPDRVGFHRAARYDHAVWDRRTDQMHRLYDRGEAVPVLEAIAAELGRPVVLITRGEWRAADASRLRLLFSEGDLRTWAVGTADGRVTR